MRPRRRRRVANCGLVSARWPERFNLDSRASALQQAGLDTAMSVLKRTPCDTPPAAPSADPAAAGRAVRGSRRAVRPGRRPAVRRSEEHTSELQSLRRISYAVFCLKKKKK